MEEKLSGDIAQYHGKSPYPELIIPSHDPDIYVTMEDGAESTEKTSTFQASSYSPRPSMLRPHFAENVLQSQTPRSRIRSCSVTSTTDTLLLLRDSSEFPEWEPGAAPGEDVHSMDEMFMTKKCKCDIQVVDYSPERIQVNDNLINESLPVFLAMKRPPWSQVRWISVNGLSWDVVKSIALNYDLHPLAVEDVFHSQRTKIDYYAEPLHFFLCLHLLKLEKDSDTSMHSSFFQRNMANHRISLHSSEISQRSRHLARAHEQFRSKRVHISVEQCFMFVLPIDNTLITFFNTSGQLITRPLLTRLRKRKTLLRNSSDATLLMQAIIDAVVDHSMPIVDKYREQICELEGKILLKPRMKYTRELHIIAGELMLLKRAIAPTLAVIQSLRDHGQLKLVSDTARTYLCDVLDHIVSVTEALETLNKVADNLINLIFNTISYRTSEDMRILSVLNIIFLPLTFIAGVYGTNFTSFPELDAAEGIWYLWRICIIVTIASIVVLCLIMWSGSYMDLLNYGRRRYKREQESKYSMYKGD
ncbi:uncharacterized protein VTP21DRAFT_10770 [Calcarisporiella thermophila]|uniref:uncharacterized protein n=1 Tax=Calcarisporiella thermophila TaxID=911321 RepID=UPI0037437A62